MRIAFLSAAAFTLFAATSGISPAFAQDMPLFSGFYAGVNGGYGFGKNTVRTTGQATVNTSTVADGARPPFAKMNNEGFLGGIQAGYDWRMGNYVVGIETDAQYADMRDTRNFSTTGTAFPGVRNNQFRDNLNYFGTTRLRLGYAWDRSMIYATGGGAYGRMKQAANFSGPLPVATPQFASTYNRTNFGYAAGGGFEQFLDDHWSIKTEYLYYNLNRSPLFANVIAGSGGVGTGYVSSFDNKGQIGRIGINYHFN